MKKSGFDRALKSKRMQNINKSKPKFNPTWSNSNQNLPQQGKWISWTAQVFQQQEQKEERPVSNIPPTMKSGQVELNGFEGCICVKCKEFYPYAEPNMDDGTMVCYGCRNPWPGN